MRVAARKPRVRADRRFLPNRVVAKITRSSMVQNAGHPGGCLGGWIRNAGFGRVAVPFSSFLRCFRVVRNYGIAAIVENSCNKNV
jgi:hypothetical protein